MLETLGEDFVRTARAKGLRRGAALWRHAVPNALIPVVTIIGLQFSFLLAGTVIIENVFTLPGLGRLVFQAIAQRDLIVVQDLVVLLAGSVIVVNFLVDLAYAADRPAPARQPDETAREPAARRRAHGAVLLLMALLSLVWTPYAPDRDGHRAQAAAACPALHPLGTDPFGRDVLSMVMAGAHNSIAVAVIAVAVGIGFGVPLGAARGGARRLGGRARDARHAISPSPSRRC